MKRLGLLTTLSLATAFLASGCLWGIVRDVNIGGGGGVQGAEVRWRDSEGNWNWAHTNANGYYIFYSTGEAGELPFPGEVWFEVRDWNCWLTNEWRLVLYDDNLQATEPSEFQERQDFDLLCWGPDDPDDAPMRWGGRPEPPPTPTPTSTPIALPWPFTPVPPPR
jgi:hypothetical protein